MRINAHARRGKMNRIRSTAIAAALLLSAGCSVMPEAPEVVALPQVRSFSSHPEGESLPPGWQPWVLSRFKRSTAYKLVNEQGRTVVRARAESSASGLIHPLKLDPQTYPVLHWHWKVDDLIQKADNTQKHLEDSPVRLVVSFGGDMDKLNVHDRMFFDNVRLLTGQQMPYATLMYIWENRAPRDTVIDNRHTSRIKMIVAESGRDRLGSWQEVTRNIVEDYKRAFGEYPGPVTAIGIMTDTDNTGDNAHAWYGDIAFHKSTLPSQPTAE
jgi:hypothetical protein